ncbi:MAG: peptidylprolyl isomerase [Anaerolineales bacterium]|nr:peptidylprolyl isomerase [Anaerolineales bacterium]
MLLCLPGCSTPAVETNSIAAPSAAELPSAASPTQSTDPITTQSTTTGTESSEPVATLAPVSDQDIILGNTGAENTLLIYADFQSPASAFFAEMIPDLLSRHPESLRIVFRTFPLITVNDKALPAAKAAEAAGRQGSFWEMATYLFAHQQEWNQLEPAVFQSWLLEQVQSFDTLDPIQFEQDLASEELEEGILSDFYQNAAAGLFETPTLILNDSRILLPLSIANIEASIRLQELHTRQFPAYPDFIIDLEKEYTATIHTSIGVLEVLLYPQYAPLAVNSFITLAKEGWYDNTPIYLVVEGSYIEAGDPSGTGLGNPGYVFPTEIDPTLDFSDPGMVAMVAPAPDANGSNFFITLKPLPHLDTYRTIFGRVTTGLVLLEELQNRDPMESLLLEPEAVLLSIDIETKSNE